jgi:hypothetical protein
MNPWSIKSEHVTSVRFNVWIDTQNNKSNGRCENNIRSCCMNIRIPPCWKYHMVVLIQCWWYSLGVANVNGLQKLENCCTYVLNNQEVL